MFITINSIIFHIINLLLIILIIRPHNDKNQHEQGISGYLAGKEVRFEQPVEKSDSREIQLKIEQPGGGRQASKSLLPKK